jgi:hypothetical protein
MLRRMSAAHATDPSDAPARSSIASLLDGKLPTVANRLLFDAASQDGSPLTFRFCVSEIPFEAKLVRWPERAVISLTGALGILPFTAESARRRQRLALIVAAARRRSSLNWAINGRQEIVVSGDIELPGRVTPTTALAGAVALMFRAKPYADLIVSVGGEA